MDKDAVHRLARVSTSNPLWNKSSAKVDAVAVVDNVDIVNLDLAEESASAAAEVEASASFKKADNQQAKQAKASRAKLYLALGFLVVAVVGLAVALVFYSGLGKQFKGGSPVDEEPGGPVQESQRVPPVISVQSLSDTESSGEVTCFYSKSAGSAPESHSFMWYSSSVSAESTKVGLDSKASGGQLSMMEGYFGYSGFEISLPSGGSDLILSLFRAEGNDVVVNLAKNVADNDTTEQFGLLVSSYVGECLVQLSLGLGELGYFAKDHKAIAPLLQLSKVFFYTAESAPSFKGATDTGVQVWDLAALKTRTEKVNQIASQYLQGNGTLPVTGRRKPVGEVIIDEARARLLGSEEERKERALLACGTSEWFRLGDGRCDPAFNNVACNFDNGDCCSSTCKNYGSLWGGLSPPDDDEVRHPVYNCYSASTLDNTYCVKSCPVLSQYFSYLGDGYCDPDLNIAACGYDLGDCCEATCVDSAYECESNGYNCKSSANGLCQRSYCGNDDFGMCGSGSSCWKWLCGDCYCHYDCQNHDQYCSCDGTLSLGCLNIFVVSCD